ncbi:hypothetical protein T552_02155 [Pneumocystis carinii B80]|uniref:Uncharacterized protein n=1 Tax=Pneumocystis carinii (strain B80) TaxID=1408658 RepID=A0A0W4ZH79_PNEC8|nr:hypothetical protein T552_02155 [Pneumocystis carinii B80]KTW27715.1 hypothetical protein T552_02155 [Pneumocystis carinii B80]
MNKYIKRNEVLKNLGRIRLKRGHYVGNGVFFYEKYGKLGKISRLMISRYYSRIWKENGVERLINRRFKRSMMMWGIGILGIYFFPVVIMGILTLITGLFFPLIFQSIFRIMHKKEGINRVFPSSIVGKYETMFLNWIKPFISQIIPDTESLAQKLYIESIKRIEKAIEGNEKEIMYVLGTENVSFEEYESFSMMGLNKMRKFSITFKVQDSYRRNEIASVSAYGVMNEYNESVILEKILITSNDNEKIILYGDVSSKKGQGKTIDAEHWTTRSLN